MGLILYYLWSASVTVILLNVLVSLFSSAYADVSFIFYLSSRAV